MKTNTEKLILAALFTALTAVSAFFQIPLGFTSVTLQTAVTILAGVLLGPRYGALSQAVYILLGLAGLPVFTKGGGLSYFLQPSMGFLLALIPAAAIAGFLYEKKKNILLSCLGAELTAYLIGTPYLGLILHMTMDVDYSIAKIVEIGCLIYLPGDTLKCLAVCLLIKPLKKALKHSE